MPEFTLEDESAFYCYVDSKQKEAESQGVVFNYEAEGKVEIDWIKAWYHHGIRLLPDPVVPAPQLGIVDNSVDDNLLNTEVYYSSFLSDDIARSAVSASASLVSSLNYFSLPAPTNRNIGLSDKNNKAQRLTVPVAFLSSSSSTDVLGLIHERTGHANKRSLIECVKSRLVTGLQIEEEVQER